MARKPKVATVEVNFNPSEMSTVLGLKYLCNEGSKDPKNGEALTRRVMAIGYSLYGDSYYKGSSNFTGNEVKLNGDVKIGLMFKNPFIILGYAVIPVYKTFDVDTPFGKVPSPFPFFISGINRAQATMLGNKRDTDPESTSSVHSKDDVFMRGQRITSHSGVYGQQDATIIYGESMDLRTPSVALIANEEQLIEPDPFFPYEYKASAFGDSMQSKVQLHLFTAALLDNDFQEQAGKDYGPGLGAGTAMAALVFSSPQECASFIETAAMGGGEIRAKGVAA